MPDDLALRHLAAIVDSSDDAIVSKTLDGTVLSWNRAAERMFGYTAEQAIGRSIRIIVPADRQSEEDEVLAKIARGESVAHFETIRRRRDGSLIPISLTVSPIRDDHGKVIGASKIARDISDRLRTEAELADLHQRLLTLVSASSSILSSPAVGAVVTATMAIAREALVADGYAIWRTDATGNWRVVQALGVSDAFGRRVIGAAGGHHVPSRTEFAEPLPIEDVSTAPLVAELRETYAAEGIRSMLVVPLAIRGDRSATLVFYFRQPHEFQELEVQTSHALANLAAAALTTAELYEEQRALRNAAEYSARQAAFLAQASALLSASLDYQETLTAVADLAVPHIADWCAVDIIDDDGRLQRLAVAHVDPDKVKLARELERRYPADPTTSGGVHDVLRTGVPAMMSRIPPDLLESLARDDEHRRIIQELALTSYMCVPLATQGRPFGAITFISAESGRQYTDADLRFVQEVAVRAGLAVENARAYRRASDANRLKDEFLATLSHELRTPLNAVLGYARMLRAGMSPSKRANAVEVLERNATALKQIIEDVLDVSRIVSGKLRLTIESLNLEDVIADALATVKPAADAKGLHIETSFESGTGAISGDADRLQQIVWNLLSNAIKFTPRDGRIQVRLRRAESQVELTVADSGQGIAPDFLPFVFDRFRQGDSRFSREHGGLGLGLAIARQLVELHGGTISAASEGSGTGATFTIRLPPRSVHRAAKEGSPQATASEPRHGAPASAPRLDGIHVLAVDDEPDALGLVRAALEEAGARVTTATSAAAVLDALADESPDVLIADIGMPGMDGISLIRAIRQSTGGRGQSVPAAALTAYARPQDRDSALANGFQMHIAKPVDPDELVVAVAALASSRSTA